MLKEPQKPLNISMIGAAPLAALIRQKDVEIFAISLRDIDKALADKVHVNPP